MTRGLLWFDTFYKKIYENVHDLKPSGKQPLSELIILQSVTLVAGEQALSGVGGGRDSLPSFLPLILPPEKATLILKDDRVIGSCSC